MFADIETVGNGSATPHAEWH